MLSISSFALFIASVLVFLQSTVDAGVVRGFKEELPQIEDLLPTFDQATRKLLTEEDVKYHTGPRHGVRDASPKIEPVEVSFMIVSCA
jgi:hypothetical protein